MERQTTRFYCNLTACMKNLVLRLKLGAKCNRCQYFNWLTQFGRFPRCSKLAESPNRQAFQTISSSCSQCRCTMYMASILTAGNLPNFKFIQSWTRISYFLPHSKLLTLRQWWNKPSHLTDMDLVWSYQSCFPLLPQTFLYFLEIGSRSHASHHFLVTTGFFHYYPAP